MGVTVRGCSLRMVAVAKGNPGGGPFIPVERGNGLKGLAHIGGIKPDEGITATLGARD